MNTRHPFVILLLAAGLAATAGCGGQPRYNLAGKVTFGGQPVALGRIFFDADANQQNSGPSGYTDIKDGVYDTARVGKGVAGGPTVVRIQGFKTEGADSSGFGPPLFQEYTVQVDLPRGNSTKDFDVPAAAASGAPKVLVPLDQGPIPSKSRT